jgi:hypothetical protein
MAVSAVVSFTDYKRLIDVMKQIDPKLVKALRKRYRQIARPVIKGIKGDIPTTAPLSGMVTKVGRLSWSITMNQGREVKSVVVRERKRAPRSKYPIVGLVQAVVRAAPTALADMAGRSGAYVNSKNETREYDYTGPQKGKPAGQLGKRKHRIRGQGRAMIRGLGGRGSRFVYPGAEASLPQAKVEMQAAVNDAVNNVNQMLRSV